MKTSKLVSLLVLLIFVFSLGFAGAYGGARHHNLVLGAALGCAAE